MLDTIRAKRGELYRIADRNKADKLYVFGSCARQEESENSDVDFLVRFRKDASLLDQVGIANDSEIFLDVRWMSSRPVRCAVRRALRIRSCPITLPYEADVFKLKPIYDALPPVEPLPDIVDLL